MHTGRRAQYRVELDEAAALQVTVSNPHGSPLAGQLIDVSGSGAGVRFLGPHCPNLAVGQEVDLVFRGEHLATPVTVAARVQHRTEERGSRRYGFRFLQAQQLDTQLSPELREFFNRRRVMRVTPDPYDPVRVTLEARPGSPQVEVQLDNISELGVRVSLEAGLEATFAETTTVGITLHLPGFRRPVELVGNVRYRRLVGEVIQYGIELDAELSEDFSRQQAMITKYTFKRVQESLRETSDPALAPESDFFSA
jgi:c-di-GMP-binding flagellar brake protein YcgR